ncbi:MAG: hydrogenase nickel insertion protein HypA [Candidatus Fraserbacteria bacterium RBG_16_55_9]|uniref:Hydrogenase maturation factor HypA n=1 Tax=Fraserbacteria sp. (strain RBG_16_55_9) TaxID=1817864 RepID=A0A1F5UYX2_FRAXR|nr:MAG: hydrogenase nickel insertion protein HypA [Candidatus Fraserbacteria bacterium RBG_16_55_9]
MHEWALAEAVVAAAVKAAKREHLDTITAIHVKLGELQQIEHEILEFALKEILAQEEPLLRSARIEFQLEKASFKCRNCQKEWTFDDADLSPEEAESIHFIPEIAHVYMRCIACSSPDFEVIHGRGIWLVSLQGVRSDGPKT